MVLSVTVSIYFFTSQQVADPPTTTTFAPLARVVFCSQYFRILCDEKTLALMLWGSRITPELPFLLKCMTRWLLIDSWAFFWKPASDLPRSAPLQALRQWGEAIATLGLLQSEAQPNRRVSPSRVIRQGKMPWLGSDQRVGALRRFSTIISFSVLGYEEGVVQVPKERHKWRMKNFPLG